MSTRWEYYRVTQESKRAVLDLFNTQECWICGTPIIIMGQYLMRQLAVPSLIHMHQKQGTKQWEGELPPLGARCRPEDGDFQVCDRCKELNL